MPHPASASRHAEVGSDGPRRRRGGKEQIPRAEKHGAERDRPDQILRAHTRREEKKNEEEGERGASPVRVSRKKPCREKRLDHVEPTDDFSPASIGQHELRKTIR